MTNTIEVDINEHDETRIIQQAVDQSPRVIEEEFEFDSFEVVEGLDL